MAIDSSEILTTARDDWGTDVIIAGQPPILGLFNPATPSAGPYLDDGGETPDSVTLLLSDLQSINQWPLTATTLICDGRTWTIIRSEVDRGALTIILRET